MGIATQEVRAALNGLLTPDRLPKPQKLVVRFGPAIRFRIPVLPADSSLTITRTVTMPVRPLVAKDIA
jgi:hypothetical protein